MAPRLVLLALSMLFFWPSQLFADAQEGMVEVAGGAEGVAPVRPIEVSGSPVVVVVGASVEQAAEVDTALGRFIDRGLALPDLSVSFHETDEPCNGHLGLFNAPGRIRICSGLPFVLTHEIAHAWERANVDEATQAELLAFTGLPSWRDADTPWNDRGAEQAAVTVQKILMTESASTDLDFWAEHVKRYEILTGLTPDWA